MNANVERSGEHINEYLQLKKIQNMFLKLFKINEMFSIAFWDTSFSVFHFNRFVNNFLLYDKISKELT